MSALNLTDDERKIATAFGLSEAEFAHERARLARTGRLEAKAADHGLSDDQMAVCRAFRVNPRRMAAAVRDGRSHTTGLQRAHDEVDRAHKEMYQSGAVREDAWANAPLREILSNAVSELQQFDPNDEERTYDSLLNGCLHAMCLLECVAPAYADIKPFRPNG